MTHQEMKEWLKSHYIESKGFCYYDDLRAAVIGSCDPFGLMTCYKDTEGHYSWYVNGCLKMNFSKK